MKRLLGRSPLVWVVVAIALAAALVVNVVVPPQASAVASATFTLTSWETMWIDSNKPDQEGPQSAFLSFVLLNTGDETLEDITVTFSGFADTTYFKDPTDTVREYNSLAPSEQVPVYFWVDYTDADATGLSTTYSISVTSSTSGFTPINYSGTVTSASALSAAAGGSDVTTILGPGIFVGQVLTQTVTYEFGNNSQVSFQPTGMPTWDPATSYGFRDTAFRLVGNELTAISGYTPSKTPTGITAGDKDQLYWPSSDIPDSGTQFTMVYYWEVLVANETTDLLPWAEGLSGTQQKYLMRDPAKDPTARTPMGPASSPSLTITKSVDPNWLPNATYDTHGLGNGIVIYTVTITNNSVSGAGDPVAINLSRIRDTLPGAMTMVDSTYNGSTSSEIEDYSSSTPASGASGQVDWKGAGARYDDRHYAVAGGGGTLTLQYTADASSCATETDLINSVTARAGNSWTTPVTDTLRIGGTPTLAVITDFQAYKSKGDVVVSWDTSSEMGTIGYYVERQDSQSDEWVGVSDELVPAMFESPGGGSYVLVDEGAKVGATYDYRLVEVTTSGSENTYGPFEVKAATNLPMQKGASGIARGKDSVRIPAQAQALAGQTDSTLNKGQTKKGEATLLRIEVGESGLYRVEAADIADALGLSYGQALKAVRSGGLLLTSQGEKVAYLAGTDGTALYFYGEAIDSLYAANNVYWLSEGKGKTMSSAKDVKLPKSGAETITEFVDQVHAEENTFAYGPLSDDPETDIWLWTYLVAGYPSLGEKTFSVDAPWATEGVQLDALLWGFSETAHSVEVQLNGVKLGQADWNGTGSKAVSLDIPGGVLQAGANEVTLIGYLGDPSSYSIVGVESFDLTYGRTTETGTGSLLLTAPSTASVEVDGVDTEHALVLDLSDARRPALVDWVEIGALDLSFNAKEGGQYLAFDTGVALQPRAVTATTEPTLTAGGRGAEYVIITAPALVDAADRYAAYRAGKGLTTAVVTTTEIYDEFNHGIADPQAVQDFIKRIVTQWSPKAKYVLLAGEGSLDFKGYLGYGDCLVPSLVIDGGLSLVTSDVALADVLGHDGLTEVAIGRIPVRTAAELDEALAKMKAYEASQGSWRQSVLLATDNPDDGGDFYAESDGLAAVLPSSLQVDKAYLGQVTLSEARSAVKGALNDGALVVNWVGHGSQFQLAAERVLSAGNVGSLSANDDLPLLVALSCQVGDYGQVGYDGLAEALVKKDGAGAIAVWAPVNAQMSADSVHLGTLLYGEMFGSSHTVVLGDVIQAARAAAQKQKLPATTLEGYNLLGDPALRVIW